MAQSGLSGFLRKPIGQFTVVAVVALVIYLIAANVSGGGSFTIYRWADADPATVATIAYGPDNPANARIKRPQPAMKQ